MEVGNYNLDASRHVSAVLCNRDIFAVRYTSKTSSDLSISTVHFVMLTINGGSRLISWEWWLRSLWGALLLHRRWRLGHLVRRRRLLLLLWRRSKAWPALSLLARHDPSKEVAGSMTNGRGSRL